MGTADKSHSSAKPNPSGKGKKNSQKLQKGGLKGGAFGIMLGVLAIILMFLVLFSRFWTELKWFEQIQAVRVFWTHYGAFLGIAAIGIVTLFCILAVSVLIAFSGKTAAGKANLRNTKPKRKDADDKPSASKVHEAKIDDADSIFANLSAQFQSQFSAAAPNRPKMPHKSGESTFSRAFIWIGISVLSIFFGGQLGLKWRELLLWFNSTPFGEIDPEFGKDVSFYVFTLPVLHEVIYFVFIALALSLVVAVVGYWSKEDIDFRKGKLRVSRRAAIHTGILAALFTVAVGAQFWLARYDLLLGNNSRFAGASFTDINAAKPGLTILTISVLLVAALFVYAAFRNSWKPAVVGVAATVAANLVLTGLYPFLVQNFQVDPNAAELESEYIQRNINATRKAYGIDEVETQQYAARTEAQSGQLRQDSETAAQIRLLDPSIVSPSFNQLQQNRQYYQFTDRLSVDRYEIDGRMRDTVIAMRELNLDGLDDSRRSWVNDHTVYTHGFGVVAAYGNTVTTKGDPAFWESGIPSSGEMGEYEPRIYFGQNSPSYSIVGAPQTAEPWELDYPDDKAPNGQVNTTYQGDGGPKISNVFAKLMYAIKFRSTELFFSDRVTTSSQILFDRDPHQRVAKVAPYLTLDSKAVPAVVDLDDDPATPKELVWIIDGYTTSNNYPYSARETLQEATADSLSGGIRGGRSLNAPKQINYIRNSVKAIVNAYDGSVTLFQWDREDPIINAWKKIFPGQVTELAKMPGDLIAHVRYPEDLFKVQRTLLARYHVQDAKSFYSGGDFWQVPTDPNSGSKEKENAPAQPPYYMTLQMPGQEQASFSLTTSYIPGGNTKRNVMTGFLAADSNAGSQTGKISDSYGKLRLLETPRDLTVEGPGQAKNTMLANPDVSQALNLLRQGGTNTREGNLLSLPIGGGLLYVQPIYVQAATGTQYPTLQYVLALFGDKVGFAPTLDQALDKVFGGDSGVQAGDAAIAGDKEAPINADAGGAADTGSSGAVKAPNSAGSDAGDQGTATPAAPAVPAPAGGNSSLDVALRNAEAAISESEAARKTGDWAAYGKAQEKLAQAIKDAVAAQRGK
ncbi:UPF0182 family protein [Arcanobacterium hippocoleae]|uniref:UPF0182 protein J2S36_000796 n=1 Tax=Arcanobacterium hippocoleae TaxID=149017 RepID=A0ABU1T1Q5_9ACTO|nr:UPF0182 family protein [Arcanobacterium hippocoleae]MDR6939253.1 uncharacterized membrane protein (UPF0182 family) [Arcanobacterium hippocoleae]